MATRRHALISALAVALTVAAGSSLAAPAKLPAQAGDMTLGSPKAKVQVIEYASLSCSHCANFHNDVFPAFKAKYIDTGKVHFTFRELLTPPAEVAAAGFLLARCAGPTKYFKVVGEVFASQERWTEGDLKPIFVEIAKANGLSEAQFDACLTDKAALEALNGRVKAALDLGVNSTPTFFVNGKKIEGEMSLQQLDAAITAAGK